MFSNQIISESFVELYALEKEIIISMLNLKRLYILFYQPLQLFET